MNDDYRFAWLYALIVVIALGLGIGAWKLKRWIHWKFIYGPKVEQRIEQLERRVQSLEDSTERGN